MYEYLRLISESHAVTVFAPITANEDYLDLRELKLKYRQYPFETGPGRIVRRLPGIRTFAQQRINFVSLPRLHRLIADDINGGGFDIAFVHHSQYTQTPYILRYIKIPNVYYCQEPRRKSFEYGPMHSSNPQGLISKLIARITEPLYVKNDILSARSAQTIIANSFYSIESIKRAYGRYAKIAYLGVNDTVFLSSTFKRENIVLSVGALDPVKGHDWAISAIALLPNDERPRLIVVADRGSSEYASSLQAQALEHRVDLEIKHSIPDDELKSLYQKARATLCMAELEPFGFTPIEAMACGSPVIAIREGGYKETVIDGTNGLLVGRDASDIAAALAKLANEKFWDQLHQGALKTPSEWKWEDSVKRLEELFEQAIVRSPKI